MPLSQNFYSNPPTITVKSPKGGEIWKQGINQTIRWTYTGDPGANMKIQLFKAGVVKKVISKSAPIGADGSGSFTWKVPFNQELGNNYKIRVISTSDPTKRDASDKVFAPPCDIHPTPAFSGSSLPRICARAYTFISTGKMRRYLPARFGTGNDGSVEINGPGKRDTRG